MYFGDFPMVLIYRSSLIVVLIEGLLNSVNGEISKFGLTEPTETTLIEMKPLYHYSFDDSDRGSNKVNRLLKKNRKKSPYGKRRDSFRLFTSDDDKSREQAESGGSSGDGGSTAGGSGEGAKVIKLDKGLLQVHKEHELDHLDHDSHSNEDKFVKMIWDKGDGFVKRWHWDRGEKIKEKHSVAEKKHLEHHDKGKVDEHIEKQQGVVVHSKAEDSTETTGIDNMAKSAVNSDKETKNDDIVKQLRMKLLPKQPLKQDHELNGDGEESADQQSNGQSVNYQEINGNNDDNESVGDQRTPNKKIVSMLLDGRVDDSDTNQANNGNTVVGDESNNQDNVNNLRRAQQLKYREILQRGKHFNHDDEEGELPQSKAYHRMSQRKKHQQQKNNEDNKSSEPAEENNGTKKRTDYHRQITVREEKSELASQERYRGGGDTEEGGKKENEDNADGNNGGDDNGYEAGSKGSGYIKKYQLTSDGQNDSLNPIDFGSIIGDQSLQIKTAVASNNQQPVNQIIKSSTQKDIDTSLSRSITNNHFQSNTLQMINPR